ncbi:MAG: putative 2-dehydropantoate 2-reductase [Verrucomicrobiota bacterium]
MHTKRQIAIIGTGAVGGYYGALLQKAGFDLHYLLHRDYEHVRQHGLIIESANGDFTLPKVAAYDNPQKMPRCDVAIVALKTTENHLLPGILPHVLKDDGMVLTLQNGLGAEESIAESIGAGRTLGGLCFLCSNKIAPGHICHIDYGLITLGEYRADGRPGGITPRLQQLADDLESAGISAKAIGDLLLARWKKLVWNIPFNGLSVTRNAMTDQLLKEAKSRDLCVALMNEVAMASAACARPIDQAFLDKMIADTERMKPYAPSMKLDFDRGRPMEIESIYGYPLRAAKDAGVAMPETEKLYNELIELDPDPAQ